MKAETVEGPKQLTVPGQSLTECVVHAVRAQLADRCYLRGRGDVRVQGRVQKSGKIEPRLDPTFSVVFTPVARVVRRLAIALSALSVRVWIPSFLLWPQRGISRPSRLLSRSRVGASRLCRRVAWESHRWCQGLGTFIRAMTNSIDQRTWSPTLSGDLTRAVSWAVQSLALLT